MKPAPFLLCAMLHAFALPCAGAQPIAEREWMPYKKLVETTRLGRFYALPAAERDKLDMYIQLQPADKASGLVLTAVQGSGRTALPVGPGGSLRLVPNPAWLADDVMVYANLPEEADLSIAPALNAAVPPGTTFPYAQLMGSVAQANAVIDRISGPFGLFAASARSVVLKFDQPARLSIQSAAGTRQYATDARHRIRLLPDSALLAENPLTVVTARPRAAELDSE